MEEQELELTDSFDESTQARIGKLVGANCVLTGFGEIYKRYYKLTLNLIDVENSRILSGSILCLKRN